MASYSNDRISTLCLFSCYILRYFHSFIFIFLYAQTKLTRLLEQMKIKQSFHRSIYLMI